jgi:hypothetical protein
MIPNYKDIVDLIKKGATSEAQEKNTLGPDVKYHTCLKCGSNND